MIPSIDLIQKFENILSKELSRWNKGIIDKWCQTFGAQHFYEWDLYLAVQMLDKEKQIIVKANLDPQNIPATRFFIVSIDLFNKVLMLGELPKHF